MRCLDSNCPWQTRSWISIPLRDLGCRIWAWGLGWGVEQEEVVVLVAVVYRILQLNSMEDITRVRLGTIWDGIIFLVDFGVFLRQFLACSCFVG